MISGSSKRFPARGVASLLLPLAGLLAPCLRADTVVTYNVGQNPHGIAFDGTNIWVANYSTNNVTKLLAASGANEGTYSVESNPQGVVFDGTSIWVVNSQASTVTKLTAATGAQVGTYDVGTPPVTTTPYGIAFDGANIWVTESLTNSVAKIQASTGNTLGTYSVGNTPYGIAFDGANIWVANNEDGTLTELQASTGNVIGTFPVGSGPHGVTFDGTYIWVTNTGDNTVSKVQTSTGNVVGTYSVGQTPVGIAYGGGTIWVANFGANTVTKLQASSGAPIGTDNVTAGPWDMVFDGANAWVTNYNNNTVTKISPSPVVSPGGVVPLYSTSNTIQPGEWVSLYGSNLASGNYVWNGNFPTLLGGTSVKINGKLAYLWSVSPEQINFQAPDDTTTGPVSVTVLTATSETFSTVTLAPIAPSFSLLDATHVTGIILRSNGKGAYGGGTYDILGPTGNSLGYATVAAKAGDTVELFGVGFGPTTPAVPAGQAFSGQAVTTNTVQLSVGGKPVNPSFSGLSSAGLYQLNVTIPVGLGAGDLPLTATVGGVQTQTGVVISLQ